MTFNEWWDNYAKTIPKLHEVGVEGIKEIAQETWKEAEHEWLEVFSHLSKNADECGNMLKERMDILIDKLQRVRDLIKFQANNVDNLVKEIEDVL